MRPTQEHQVGHRRPLRIAQDRRPAGAEVAREHDDPSLGTRGDRQFDARRAEDMPRLEEPGADPGSHRRALPVTQPPSARLHLLHVAGSEQRRERCQTLAAPTPVLLEKIGLPDALQVGQQQRREIERGRGRVDMATEAVRRQQRQTARVVDVRMGQDDGGERLRVHRA
ncbi:MAG: hypothetical protein L6Q83_12280 [Gammaproteobacteria bacterium]|nr:hypothetical protein [Gammaproteobacteria bacterium]